MPRETFSTRWAMALVLVLLSTIYSAECSRRKLPTLVNTRVGEEVKMTCPLEREATFVNWYHNGDSLTQNADFRMKKGELKIKNVRMEDRGFYSCEGIDGFGTQPRTNFTLLVYGQDVSSFPEHPVLGTFTERERPIVVPRFIENPPGQTEQEFNIGSSPKLRCQVEANAHASIDWYRNGLPVDYLRGNLIKDRYSLKFSNLQLGDAGRYTCKVYNGYGSVNFNYTVIVTDPNVPIAKVIPPYPLNTSVTFGSAASLQCKVRSNSRPTIMWLKKQGSKKQDGYSIKIQGKVYTVIKNETMMVETEEGAYLNKLVIPDVKMEDAGVYVCFGLNQRGGSDIREALLTVIRPRVMTTATPFPAVSDTNWEYIFGSPSATLAVLIAIPVVIILIVTIAIIYGLNKRKKNSGIRRPPSNVLGDHEVAVPLNMNANNGCYSGQYGGGSTSSYNKVALSGHEGRYSDKLYTPPSYRNGSPQQYTQYLPSDGSYRSSLHYPPQASVHQQRQAYLTDIADTDSHFSSVSHTRPQYMTNSRNPYDDRDIHSDPPTSRVGGHHCPPPPPGSYYSEQW